MENKKSIFRKWCFRSPPSPPGPPKNNVERGRQKSCEPKGNNLESSNGRCFGSPQHCFWGKGEARPVTPPTKARVCKAACQLCSPNCFLLVSRVPVCASSAGPKFFWGVGGGGVDFANLVVAGVEHNLSLQRRLTRGPLPLPVFTFPLRPCALCRLPVWSEGIRHLARAML